ncbi:MAG: winged helix-turn-helix transcriptional regulator, partial [Methanoregula sp.]|nr:winged helix-turn-helix transcriptional regulator [Methanoregula sp.]
MIRNSAWALILLLLAAVVSPLPAASLTAGATTMPMHTGSSQAAASTTGCNCNMPMPAAAAPSPATSLPRQAGGADPAPCNGSALPTLPGTAAVPGRFSGIRRIYPKNVLDHPERAAIHALIVARPGIDSTGIASEMGMNRETLRYHLGMLESAVKIVVMRDRGIVRYYENHGRYTLLERKVLQHLWNPTGKAMLAVIAARPGITQSGIAANLGITASTVRWYMHRFRADGIVSEEHAGRYTRYTTVPEVSRLVIPPAATELVSPVHCSKAPGISGDGSRTVQV